MNRWTTGCPALDSACPDEVRSLTGRGAAASRPVRVFMPMRKIDLTSFQVATSETARQINRRIALSLIRRHEPLSRADLARRSGPAAQHRVGDHRRADRRGLGQRGRAGAAAARPPAAFPPRQHRTRRDHRRRAAARHHDRRPCRSRRPVQGPGAVEHAADARGLRGPAARDGDRAPRRSSRRPGSKASASACPAASTRKGA